MNLSTFKFVTALCLFLFWYSFSLYGSVEVSAVKAYSVHQNDSSQVMTKSELLAWGKINVYIKNFDFDYKYAVVSYRVSIIIPGYQLEVLNLGAAFTQETIKIIKRVKRNGRVYFDNIKVRSPDGKTQKIDSFNIKIR